MSRLNKTVARFSRPIRAAAPRVEAIPLPYTLPIFENSTLKVGRRVELANLLLGFEQANQYSIKDQGDNEVGIICEEKNSFSGTIMRQLLRTRRSFKAEVVGVDGEVKMTVRRGIKLFLNAEMEVLDKNGEQIGLIKSDWHLWRRRFDVFVGRKQISRIDEGFLSWKFEARDEREMKTASIERIFQGLATEVFTDIGQYKVDYEDKMSSDVKKVLLATAIMIDIDFFSQHSSAGGGLLGGSGMPIGMMGGMGGMGGGGGEGGSETEAGSGDVPSGPSRTTNEYGDEIISDGDSAGDGGSWYDGFLDD